jgi:hypothetical protein
MQEIPLKRVPQWKVMTFLEEGIYALSNCKQSILFAKFITLTDLISKFAGL